MIYTVEQLREMPDGTVFEHVGLGKCEIYTENGEKFMKFHQGIAPAGFCVNSYPGMRTWRG